MQKVKTIAAAVMLAGGALMMHGAMAADVSNPDKALDLTSGGDIIGHVFSAGNMANGFSERYTFTVGAGSSIYADVFSNAASATTGLDILGLSLFDSNGLVLKGSQLSTGKTDQWELTSGPLSAGSYFLLVSGTVLSSAVGSYSGSATVTAVPEPETYAMLLGGLGVVGALARRKRKQADLA